MSLAGWTYAGASRLLGLIAPALLAGRVRRGKEDGARLNERFATGLLERPTGKLVWLHGASVGESLLLLALGEALQARNPGLNLVFTSQTQTSARLVASRLPELARHQMAPLDSPVVAKRFIAHWRPDLAIFAEGEIWPNLLFRAKRTGARLALVNARMQEKSRKGWARAPSFSRGLFGAFDVIVAADEPTGRFLEQVGGKPVLMPGNLKSALPPPPGDPDEAERLRASFIAGRQCLLAASTHPGEEDILLKAWESLSPRPVLILVPRHPERAGEIAGLLSRRGFTFSTRSHGAAPREETDVYLADTIGEMGLWLSLCHAVFLGGASVPAIGGHNPIEALLMDKPVVTGPHHFNFEETFAALSGFGALNVAEAGEALQSALSAALDGRIAIDSEERARFLASARAPLETTLDALAPLLGRQS